MIFRQREREEERQWERNIDLLFHFFMYSLIGSCTCPDRRLNPHTTLVYWGDALTNWATWPGQKFFFESSLYTANKYKSGKQFRLKESVTINIPDILQQTDRYYLHSVSRTHNLAVYQNTLGVWIQNDPYKKIHNY